MTTVVPPVLDPEDGVTLAIVGIGVAIGKILLSGEKRTRDLV
jgi:hypothetical protein